MNVLVVVTDRKIANSTETAYDANVISTSDYYPYGMQKKDRSLTEMAFYDKYAVGNSEETGLTLYKSVGEKTNLKKQN